MKSGKTRIHRITKLLPAAFLALILLCGAFGDEESSSQEQAPPTEKLQPAFSVQNRNIVFVEGEEAVSTNFCKEPTLNYSTSGSRTLQLNRTTGLQAGAAFYAEYVFYVEEPGSYEFWYGGTPPGSGEEIYPAYASPFHYSFNDEESNPAYREDIVVAEQYTPVYYWCLVEEREFRQGQHTLRFIVDEKRNYDGRYFFYLDCFFLVRKVDGKRLLSEPLPEVFPENPGSRAIDYPFRDIEDYLIIIREDPGHIEPYVDLSYIYSLVGDYLNALKHLRRAITLDPDNLNLLHLQAKNRIWKGDIQEGLDGYSELLVLEPDKLDRWIEAGKIAAWTGRYDDSVAFFEAGLEKFPDNMDLMVNLGLTYLWSGREREANELFRQTKEIAAVDAPKLIELGNVFRLNGYPDRAVEIYREAIKRYPSNLEAYLLLEETYFNTEQQEKAEEAAQSIASTFVQSEKLSQTLELFHKKMEMKLRIMTEYESLLKDNPDNLELRELLAQTYFWNGYKSRGIEEYRHILLNHSFRSMTKLVADSYSLLEILDQSYIYRYLFAQVSSGTLEKEKTLKTTLDKYKSAQKAFDSFLAKAEEAKNKGEKLPVPEGDDPQDILNSAGKELANSLRAAKSFLESYGKLTDSFDSIYTSQSGLLAQLQGKEAKDDEVFQKIIKSSRWRWDKTSTITELEEQKANPLAQYLLGRTSMFDGKLTVSEKLFSLKELSGSISTDYRHALFQSVLWQGKTEDALSMLDDSEADLVNSVPYLANLSALSKSLISEEGVVYADVDEARVEQAVQDLARVRKDAADLNKKAEESQGGMISLLSSRLERYIYHLQENTYLLRRELGDYYFNEENLEDAIYQYQQVLAIDPWDIGTIYRLGNVYEWNGNWRQAMQNYERIYYQDPLYENAAQLYNQLSRLRADSAAFSAYTLADTSRVIIHTEASYLHPAGALFGWNIKYEADSSRLYVPPTPEDPSIYRVQTVTFGLPFELLSGRWKVRPQAGVVLWDSQLADPTGIEPAFAMDTSLALGSAVYLSGGYRFERQEVTFTPTRNPVYHHSGELSIGVNLSFIDAYPFRDSSMRTYGKVAFLTDSNIIYEGLQELNIGLLTIDKPYITLKLLVNFLMQDSKFEEEKDYYTPRGVLVAGGGLMGSSWFNIGEESALGITLRASGAFYGDHMFTPSESARAQMDFEGNLEYVKGEAVIFMGAQYSTTYPLDYWSFLVRMGFTTRLSRLLAP
jgi:tetratricopeptide (TPR) repeat protein